MKNYKTITFGASSNKEIEPFLKLWIYRILVQLGGMKFFLEQHGFADEGLAEFLGLGRHLNLDNADDFNRSQIRREIISRAQLAEKEEPNSLLPKELLASINNLAKLVGLNDCDKKILGFAILLNTEDLLDTACGFLGQLVASKTYRALSVILNISENDIKQALGANGSVYRSGLLKMEDGLSFLPYKLELFSSRFADAVLTGEVDPVKLFKETVTKSSPANLTLGDYQHVKQIDMLIPLIKEALDKRIKGINIYIYGQAGTGKTQLAKVIAEQFKTELFEISCEDEDGDPINGASRLRAFSAAQSFLKNRKALLLFDEVEDVFNDDDGKSFWGGKSTAQKRKAWMNRALEENDIPTIWLSNTRYGLDPAFVRRYSMVFELGVPPESQRAKVLNHYAGNVVNEHVIKQLSKSGELAPAVIANATRVTKIIENKTASSADVVFSTLINQTLEAQDYQTINVKHKVTQAQPYDTNYLNASIDIDKLIVGLDENRAGRICFYGPPGTGKTALGKHIAEKLDIPFICKKVSDLLSKWVGGTEKNIAKAFKDASEEGALLLIDEVDSFLQDRTAAQNSWEQTQVNEMLTQMENFEGIFIASTNLIDTLDAASIRRFDAKVKFDYLTQLQLMHMIKDFCESFDVKYSKNLIEQSVKHLHAITPGDFALIGRQINFNPIDNYEDLITRLEEEQEIKGESKSRMGFI